LLDLDQRAMRAQFVDNGVVGFEHRTPGIGAGVRGEATGSVDGSQYRQTVLLSDREVFVSVPPAPYGRSLFRRRRSRVTRRRAAPPDR